jgi:nicotinamidase/pyrazinamidase
MIYFFEIDAQRDFMDETGALYVPDAEAIKPRIRRLLLAAGEHRITTFSSRCAHQPGDQEFEIFPPHCLEGSVGAKRIFENLPGLPRLEIPVGAPPDQRLPAVEGLHYLISKNVFDIFSNPWLDGVRKSGWFADKTCIVFGVATDYCVKACGNGLVEAGATTLFVEDAIRGVAAETTAQTLAEAVAAGVALISTERAIALASHP